MADETALPEQHEIELPNGIVVSGMGGDVEALQDAMEARHEERTGTAAPESSDESHEDAPESVTPVAEASERPMSRATRRVKEAVDKANAAEKARVEMEARVRELEARLTAAPKVADAPVAAEPTQTPVADAAPTRPKPVPSQFEDYDQYYEALSDWKIEQRTHEILLQAEARAQARIEGDRAAQSFAAHAKQVFQRGQEAYPDFDTVIASANQQMSPLHAQAILNSPQPEHVMYAFAKNQDQFNRFVQTTDPLQLGLMLGQMGTAPSSVVSVAPTRPATTNAPAPPQPLGSSAKTSHPSLHELAAAGNYEAYKARRRAELSRG